MFRMGDKNTVFPHVLLKTYIIIIIMIIIIVIIIIIIIIIIYIYIDCPQAKYQYILENWAKYPNVLK